MRIDNYYTLLSYSYIEIGRDVIISHLLLLLFLFLEMWLGRMLQEENVLFIFGVLQELWKIIGRI